MKVYNPITKMMEDKSKSIKAKDSKEDERKKLLLQRICNS